MGTMSGWLKRGGGSWNFFGLNAVDSRLDIGMRDNAGRVVSLASAIAADFCVDVDPALLARLTFSQSLPEQPLSTGKRAPFILPGGAMGSVTLTWATHDLVVGERVPQCIFLVQWLLRNGCKPADTLGEVGSGARRLAGISGTGSTLLGVAASAASLPATVATVASGAASAVQAASAALPALASIGGAAANVLFKVAGIAEGLPFIGAAAKVLLLMRDAVAAVQAYGEDAAAFAEMLDLYARAFTDISVVSVDIRSKGGGADADAHLSSTATLRSVLSSLRDDVAKEVDAHGADLAACVRLGSASGLARLGGSIVGALRLSFAAVGSGGEGSILAQTTARLRSRLAELNVALGVETLSRVTAGATATAELATLLRTVAAGTAPRLPPTLVVRASDAGPGFVGGSDDSRARAIGRCANAMHEAERAAMRMTVAVQVARGTTGPVRRRRPVGAAAPVPRPSQAAVSPLRIVVLSQCSGAGSAEAAVRAWCTQRFAAEVEGHTMFVLLDALLLFPGRPAADVATDASPLADPGTEAIALRDLRALHVATASAVAVLPWVVVVRGVTSPKAAAAVLHLLVRAGIFLAPPIAASAADGGSSTDPAALPRLFVASPFNPDSRLVFIADDIIDSGDLGAPAKCNGASFGSSVRQAIVQVLQPWVAVVLAYDMDSAQRRLDCATTWLEQQATYAEEAGGDIATITAALVDAPPSGNGARSMSSEAVLASLLACAEAAASLPPLSREILSDVEALVADCTIAVAQAEERGWDDLVAMQESPGDVRPAAVSWRRAVQKEACSLFECLICLRSGRVHGAFAAVSMAAAQLRTAIIVGSALSSDPCDEMDSEECLKLSRDSALCWRGWIVPVSEQLATRRDVADAAATLSTDVAAVGQAVQAAADAAAVSAAALPAVAAGVDRIEAALASSSADVVGTLRETLLLQQRVEVRSRLLRWSPAEITNRMHVTNRGLGTISPLFAVHLAEVDEGLGSVLDLPPPQMSLWRYSSLPTSGPRPRTPALLGTTSAAAASLASPRRMLHVVAGGAGSGKTTLLQALAYSHALTATETILQGPAPKGGVVSGRSLVSNFDRVVLVRLRDLLGAVRNAWPSCKTVGEATASVVADACGLSPSTHDMAALAVDLFSWANAKRTLWLLDGFDEIASFAPAQCCEQTLGAAVAAAHALHVARGPRGEDFGSAPTVFIEEPADRYTLDGTPGIDGSVAAAINLTAQSAAVLRVLLTQPHVVVSARPKSSRHPHARPVHPATTDGIGSGECLPQPRAPLTAEELAASVPGAVVIRLELLSHAQVRTFIARCVAAPHAGGAPGASGSTAGGRLLLRVAASSELTEALRSPVMLRLAALIERGHAPQRPPAAAGGAVIAGERRGQGGAALDLPERAPLVHLCAQLEVLLVEQLAATNEWDVLTVWADVWPRLRAGLAGAALSACATGSGTTVWWPGVDIGVSNSAADRALLQAARIIDWEPGSCGHAQCGCAGLVEFPHPALHAYFAATAAVAALWPAAPTAAIEAAAAAAATPELARAALVGAGNTSLRGFSLALAPTVAAADALASAMLPAALPADSALADAAVLNMPALRTPGFLREALPACAFTASLSCRTAFSAAANFAWLLIDSKLDEMDTGAQAEILRSVMCDDSFWAVADMLTGNVQRDRAIGICRASMRLVNLGGSGRRAVRAARILESLRSTRACNVVFPVLQCMLCSHRVNVAAEAMFACGIISSSCYESLRDVLLRLAKTGSAMDGKNGGASGSAAPAPRLNRRCLAEVAGRAAIELLRLYAADDVVHEALLEAVARAPDMREMSAPSDGGFLLSALVEIPDPRVLSHELLEVLLKNPGLPPDAMAKFLAAYGDSG